MKIYFVIKRLTIEHGCCINKSTRCCIIYTTPYGEDVMSSVSRKNVFAEFLFEKMKDMRISLRELSRRSGIDVSYLSRLYRGVVYPPQKEDLLNRISEAISLTSEERLSLIEKAKFVNGKLIEELETVRTLNTIPLLLRSIENKKLNDHQIEQLVELINSENRFMGRGEE